MCDAQDMTVRSEKRYRDVTVKVGRYCAAKIFGICVDWHGIFENRVEEYAVNIPVPDTATRAAKNSACMSVKNQQLNNLKELELNIIEHIDQFQNETPYQACLNVFNYKLPKDQ